MRLKENSLVTGRDADSTAEQRLEQLRLLLSRVDAAHDAQHQTLARELHHKVVGTLSALKMECDWLLRPQTADDAMRQRLQRLSEELDATIQFTRHIINELWPAIVAHLGLASAVQQQIADTRARSDASIELAIEGDVDGIAEARAIALYRLLRHVLDQCEGEPPRVREARIALRGRDATVELHIELDAAPAADDDLLLMHERIARLGGQLSSGMSQRGGSCIDVGFPATS